jgi:hypothetical protein
VPLPVVECGLPIAPVTTSADGRGRVVGNRTNGRRFGGITASSTHCSGSSSSFTDPAGDGGRSPPTGGPNGPRSGPSHAGCGHGSGHGAAGLLRRSAWPAYRGARPGRPMVRALPGSSSSAEAWRLEGNRQWLVGSARAVEPLAAATPYWGG